MRDSLRPARHRGRRRAGHTRPTPRSGRKLRPARPQRPKRPARRQRPKRPARPKRLAPPATELAELFEASPVQPAGRRTGHPPRSTRARPGSPRGVTSDRARVPEPGAPPARCCARPPARRFGADRRARPEAPDRWTARPRDGWAEPRRRSPRPRPATTCRRSPPRHRGSSSPGLLRRERQTRRPCPVQATAAPVRRVPVVACGALGTAAPGRRPCGFRRATVAARAPPMAPAPPCSKATARERTPTLHCPSGTTRPRTTAPRDMRHAAQPWPTARRAA